tara:strand:+ start:1752 stop:2840 length:1089 start_codon:yes stop_codon:yes gene_type:complete
LVKEKKINIAIIGCGRVASHHILAIEKVEGLNLIAICDLNQSRLQSMEVDNSVAKYSNYNSMLNQLPQIDVVSIITPSGAHFNHAIEIVNEYKKSVVIEKPIVMRPSEGELLMTAAKQNNVFVFPSHQYRFNKCVQRIKKGLINGELGDPFLATVRMRWCRPQSYYDRDAWRGTYAMDGGCFTNQGIHHLDLLRYLCGEVKRVNAILKTYGSNIEVEDTGVVNLEFENGGLGVLEITTAARPKDFESSLSILGSKGIAMLGGWATDKLLNYSPDKSQEALFSEEFPTAYGFGHIEIYKGVYNKIKRIGSEAVELKDALLSIKFLHAIYVSDEKNSWVDLNSCGESQRLGIKNKELDAFYKTS